MEGKVATYLNKEQILASTARKYVEVEVPELGGTVVVQTLTGAEYDEFQQSLLVERKDGTVERNLKNLRARYVARVVVDPETKQPMFDRANINLLGNLPAPALSRVYDEAQKLNGLREEDVEQEVKNS
jgi:hypothetical protein